MPRFVVLQHDSPRGLHWDFMLEHGGVLKTWALARAPDAAPEQTAEALADHRPHYLDYEGPVSGNRGTVHRWDQGDYSIEQQTADRWRVLLAGSILRGPLLLTRLLDRPGQWQFQFEGAVI